MQRQFEGEEDKIQKSINLQLNQMRDDDPSPGNRQYLSDLEGQMLNKGSFDMLELEGQKLNTSMQNINTSMQNINTSMQNINTSMQNTFPPNQQLEQQQASSIQQPHQSLGSPHQHTQIEQSHQHHSIDNQKDIPKNNIESETDYNLIKDKPNKETKKANNPNESENSLVNGLTELNDLVIKNKRRTRDESTNDRNYSCGCGKSYLSYPALYLHLKNKHCGKPPSGTLLPSNQMKKHKPGKENHQLLLQGEHLSNNNNYSFLPDTQQFTFQDNRSIQDLLLFLKEVSPTFLLQNDLDLFHQPTIDSLLQHYYLLFPHDKTLKLEFTALLNDKTNLLKIKKISHSDQNNLEVNSSPINQVFAFFLFQISKFVTFDVFKEISFFVELFRYVLNKDGSKIIQSEQNQQQQQQQNLEFCQQNDAGQILECANVLITDYFMKFLSKEDQKTFAIFGISFEQMKNAIQFTQQFSNWLYKNRFTNSKLIMSNDPQ